MIYKATLERIGGSLRDGELLLCGSLRSGDLLGDTKYLLSVLESNPRGYEVRLPIEHNGCVSFYSKTEIGEDDMFIPNNGDETGWMLRRVL